MIALKFRVYFVIKKIACITILVLPCCVFGQETCLQKAEKFIDAAKKLEKTKLDGSVQQAALFQNAQDNFLCAASEGYADAGVEAAALSMQGKAKQLDQQTVNSLLQRAAEKGNAEAAQALATELCGRKLSGCDAPAKAKPWLEMATAKGNSVAAIQLGSLNEDGYEGSPNLPKAKGCYETAAKLGNPLGNENRERLKRLGVDHSTPCIEK